MIYQIASNALDVQMLGVSVSDVLVLRVYRDFDGNCALNFQVNLASASEASEVAAALR